MTPPASAAAPTRRLASSARLRATTAAGTYAPPIRPVRRRAHARPRAVPAPPPGLARQALELIVAVPEHRLLDRLVRGRLWIGLLAFALIGIVAMQLLVLKLNTGIGRELQRSAQLQRENADLSIENSTAAAGENIEPQAIRRGMQIAPAGAIQFLYAGPSDIATAAARLRHWNPTPSTPSSTATSETGVTATTNTEPTQPAPASTQTTSTQTTQTSASEPNGQTSEASSAQSSATGTSAPAESPAASPTEPASGSEAQAATNPATAPNGGTQAQG